MKLLCSWDFSGKNTWVGCHFLPQGIFLSQGSSSHLLCRLHCRQILYREAQISLLSFMSNELVMVSNHHILCQPLLILPSIFPSTRAFSNRLALHIQWWKYWSFSFINSPSNVYSGLISFGIDWFDLLAVQGTLRNLQHNSSKASILWCSAFFMVQLAHLYMTTGKS